MFTADFITLHMGRIVPVIGYMRLTDIRPQHLNNFYKMLMEKGVRSKKLRVHTKLDLGVYLEKHHISRSSLAKQAHDYAFADHNRLSPR